MRTFSVELRRGKPLTIAANLFLSEAAELYVYIMEEYPGMGQHIVIVPQAADYKEEQA